jgi:hypothetical protein
LIIDNFNPPPSPSTLLPRCFARHEDNYVLIDIVIAGLSVAGFDELRKESGRRLAPSGNPFARPVKKPGYPRNAALQYQEEVRDRILALPETTQISLTIAYVDYSDETTKQFIEAFRPFALARPIKPLREQQNGREYREYLVDQAKELRDRASRVSEFTNIANVTPFLLPYRNFDSPHHAEMVEHLYNSLGVVDDISAMMQTEKNKIAGHHPRVKPPNGQQSCYSDGRLFFKSPGRARHGYFRHTATQGHHPSCLLAARCRFGGSYPHNLHYDCEPVTQLEASYPNCHGAGTRPGANHVNICPNDYII